MCAAGTGSARRPPTSIKPSSADWTCRDAVASGARGREFEAEEASGRSDARQCGAEGSDIKKMVTPGAKREAVPYTRDHHGLRERRACSLVGVSRQVIRYGPTRPDDGVLCGNACASWRPSAAGSAIAAWGSFWRRGACARITRSCCASIAKKGCGSAAVAVANGAWEHGPRMPHACLRDHWHVIDQPSSGAGRYQNEQLGEDVSIIGPPFSVELATQRPRRFRQQA